MKSVYVDISALEAIVQRNHPNHSEAKRFLQIIQARNLVLISAKQTLISLADKLKTAVLDSDQDTQNSEQTDPSAFKVIDALYRSNLILFEPINPDDEDEAWRIFRTMNDPWWDYMHCISLALINRLEIESVFGFEKTYKQYGLGLLPEDYNS